MEKTPSSKTDINDICLSVPSLNVSRGIGRRRHGTSASYHSFTRKEPRQSVAEALFVNRPIGLARYLPPSFFRA